MDVQALRDLLRPEVGNMKDNGPDRQIRDLCKSIGLPVPGPATDIRARLYAAFDALPDAGVPGFAQGLLDQRLLTKPRVRNDVQDVLWSARPEIDVSKPRSSWT